MPVQLSVAEEYAIANKSTVIGQNYGDPSVGERPPPVGRLDLLLETAFFAKNLELTGYPAATGVDGETFIGFLMPARVRFRPHTDLALELGGLFGQNFGDDDDLDVAEPLARLIYGPQEDLFLIAGTILPTHWIHDGLLDDVQRFRTNTEQGFQLRVDRPRLKQDSWINWRIRERQNQAEEFEVGSATQIRFLDDALRLEGQLFWAHIGGQKNSTGRVANNRTLAAGASYGLTDPFGGDCIDALRIGAHYLNSHDELVSDHDGDGVEFSLHLDTYPKEAWLVRWFGAYFKGSGFSSWRGDPLYQFEEYSQVGCSTLFSHPGGFSLEAGLVGQRAGGRFNYTFLVNFLWGQAFSLQPWRAQ